MIRKINFELTTEEVDKIQEVADILIGIKDIAGESSNGVVTDEYGDITSYDSLDDIIHVLQRLVDNKEYTVN